MLLLNSSEISSALRHEADQASSTGLMTYNFAGRQAEHLLPWRELRLIMGVSREDERSIRSAGRFQAFANFSANASLRVLPESHVKLAVFWTSARRGKLRAILSTMNGVSSHTFRELGIIVTGNDAKKLAAYFEASWKIATPINPLDIRDIARVLTSSVFEVKETT